MFPALKCLCIVRHYVAALCEEINDTLQEVGQMTVADLSKSFALPNNFLVQVRTYACIWYMNMYAP